MEGQKTDQEADKKDYTSVKYGVFMEKINTKLRRIMLTNPFVQKGELVDLLKTTVSIEKDIGNDKELDNNVKTDLVTRLDTFAWFMTSMLDEITDLEKASKNQIEKDTDPEFLDEDQNYFG